jgi:hypothetical protein
LRTLQRRIAKWRATVITTFDDQWLQEEVLADAKLPRPLRAVSASDKAASGEALAAGQSEGVWSDPIAVEQQASEQVPADTVCALGNL